MNRPPHPALSPSFAPASLHQDGERVSGLSAEARRAKAEGRVRGIHRFMVPMHAKNRMWVFHEPFPSILPVGTRCRASHFSVTRVSAREEMVPVTHGGRNIAVLVPVEFGRRGNAALPTCFGSWFQCIVNREPGRANNKKRGIWDPTTMCCRGRLAPGFSG